VCGNKKGLVGQICNASESAGSPKPMALHCITHQQALCGKSMDMLCIVYPVVATVNLIHSLP
jgi:hypothetical protein